jgi:hypothetical protein
MNFERCLQSAILRALVPLSSLFLLSSLTAGPATGQVTAFRMPLSGSVARESLSDQSASEQTAPDESQNESQNESTGESADNTATDAEADRHEEIAPRNMAGPIASRVDAEDIRVDTGDIRNTAEFLQRRERIRECLRIHYARPEDSAVRSPWGLMHGMLAFGVDTEVLVQGHRVNAVNWLCRNGKGQDLQILEVRRGKLQPTTGPGVQGHDAQLLFMLAQCKVPIDYPIVVDRYHFTVADLVEYEKGTCESGLELNFKLVGLIHFLDSDASWTTRRRERWDFPRMIREELTQPIVGACCGGTHRLMGFSYAVRKREQRGEPVVGQWLRAKTFIEDYQRYAFKLQFPDGSFSTDWFRSRQKSDDMNRALETTGHMFEWLTFSLPDEELTKPHVVKTADYLCDQFLENREHEWGVGPKGHALHALALYDERVFGSKPGHRPFLTARQ